MICWDLVIHIVLSNIIFVGLWVALACLGQKCEAYFRKFDNWAAQNGKTIIKEAKGKQ